MEASTDLVNAIEERLRAIDAQLSDCERLARERDRLRRALHELQTDAGPAPARAGGARPEGRRSRAGRAGSRRRSPSRRAQRGSNLAAIVGHVGENPGATAGEIADATGIDRGVVYSATSRLASAGRLRRTTKGGRQVGYELAADAGPLQA